MSTIMKPRNVWLRNRYYVIDLTCCCVLHLSVYQSIFKYFSVDIEHCDKTEMVWVTKMDVKLIK